MSREIKFRFVDTGDGTVYQPITLVELLRRIEIPRRIVLESENGHWVDTDDFLDLFEKGELVADEYTGLKDKNGKEIYEGDIFKVDRGSVNGVVSFEEMCDSDVVWYYLGWGVNGASLVEWSDMGQVVGNIHENPELIEKEKK